MQPSACDDLETITHTIAQQESHYLEKVDYLIHDAESGYLTPDINDDDAPVHSSRRGDFNLDTLFYAKRKGKVVYSS